MLLRRFKPAGLERFRAFIATLQVDKTLPPPPDLLENDAETELVMPPTECPDAVFKNRFAVAEYLDALMTPIGLAGNFKDVELWAWLTLRFFGQLRPIGTGMSVKKLGVEAARFIPLVDNPRRYYRHLLLGPSVIYQAHRSQPGHITGLLSDQVHIATSDVFRSFVENPELIRSQLAVSMATVLYYDPVKQKNRVGSGSGGKIVKPGSCRRLISMLQQFDCTFDLDYMPLPILMGMLPPEFEQFQPKEMLFAA